MGKSLRKQLYQIMTHLLGTVDFDTLCNRAERLKAIRKDIKTFGTFDAVEDWPEHT